ncbi:MAG: NAD(P)-dependent oxidoreductase [Dehalococcoidia bacterium]
MTRVAFIGLGRMGLPMAQRLLEGGHEVVAWNRTAEKAQPLVAAGAAQATTPRDAVKGSEAVITMLSTPEAVEGVLFGARGLAARLQSGMALIEMSTIGPSAVGAIAERLPGGVTLLDAPVLGSIPQATEGSLRIFVGGAEVHFARWRDLLSAMGDPIYIGPSGAGAAMKLVANSTLAACIAALGEALALGDSLGLDQEKVLDLLPPPMQVTVSRARESILSGSYPPAFKLSLAAKDMRLVVETAETLGKNLALARAVAAALASAEGAGLAELNYSALIAHLRGLPAGE